MIQKETQAAEEEKRFYKTYQLLDTLNQKRGLYDDTRQDQNNLKIRLAWPVYNENKAS